MNDSCLRFVKLMILFVGMMALTACGSDEPSDQVADPSDAIIADVPNIGEEGRTSLGDGLYVIMDQLNNLEAKGNRDEGVEIADIGHVAGLGYINTIPSGEWKSKVAAKPGNGYIIRYYDANERLHYVRLYVMEFLSSPEGDVSGIRIKYQNPFQLPIEPDSLEVIFDADGAGLTKSVKMKNYTDVDVKEKPEWITSVSVSGTSIILEASSNPTSAKRTGKVVLYNNVGEVTVTVIQGALFAGGSGTPDDPFLVSNAKELDNVRMFPEAYYKQIADIHLTDSDYSYSEYGWKPIKHFAGVYNGDMHKITGLRINFEYGDAMGLFSTIDAEKAEVKGVVLEEVDILGFTAGGICGNLKRGKISECSVSGSITGRDGTSGIAAGNSKGGIVERCRFTGRIYGRMTGCEISAGIAAGADVYDSYCEGELYVYYAFTKYGTATRCYIRNKQTTMLVDASGISCFKWGWGNSQYPRMAMQSTYQGWDFETVWQIDEGKSLPELRCFSFMSIK